MHHHPATGTHNWYAPARLRPAAFERKLNEELVPVYRATTNPVFTASLGDPLEIAVFKILRALRQADRRLNFLGAFDLSARNENGRYPKTQPPVSLNDSTLSGPPDFVMYHPTSSEAALIECKNLREWLYPSSGEIKELVAKALICDMTPILVARRLPYITKVALCEPAGIIAHETYNQLYPETDEGRELAAKVIRIRGLGYFDVRASEAPSEHTIRFFRENVPTLLPLAAAKFHQNRGLLQEWIDGGISWPTLRLNLGSGYTGPDQDMPLG
jgi:hypothetical protein